MFECRRLLIYLFFLSIFIFSDIPAFAHKVSIFAWVEGDTVYTQSKFSRGRKTKGAPVIVFDPEGNKLLEGKTDDKGEFSFKMPKKTALKIVLKASMGHMAEWKIPLEEVTDSDTESDIKDFYESSSQIPIISLDPDLPVYAESSTGLSKEEIQKLIDESLDRKLAPIMNMLADSYDDGPSLTEIISGIGYIFGLVGVAMYFASRKKKKW